MKLIDINKFVFIAMLTACLSACNKDDIIESPANPDDGNCRYPTSGCSNYCNKVYEYTPAPGQFINDTSTGGMTGIETTPELAAKWAEKRLEANLFVSLGAFGGYIVVGFDHSIIANNHEGYDFAIFGNAFFNANTTTGGSNEPGIVYVMQDTNGNGLPDDTWYELRGSETDIPTTITDYEITYYRPTSPQSDVIWTDNQGNSGTVDYLSAFHPQDHYYPMWINEDSYTLKGTCLASHSVQEGSSGLWNNNAFGWGYADNMGSDNIRTDTHPQCNRFRISDAMLTDGKPANLEYIDFIKVQTAVNSKSGWLGEVSTEVFGFEDLNMTK